MANSACRESNGNLDRISQLPEVLIQHILSFLPTKDALATSILSKRWLLLWTYVPVLDLKDSPFCLISEKHRADFIQFITKVLFLNTVPCLDKIVLKFHPVYPPFCVSSWIWAVSTRDIQELDIAIHEMENFPLLKLPCALFRAKTLNVLKLSHGIELDAPETVSLPSLKVLHLVLIKYTNEESASRLFTGCPVLQELVVQKFDGDNALSFTISIPTLKSLSISFGNGLAAHKLNINVPLLEYLNFHTNLPLEYHIENVSNLFETNATFLILENHHFPVLKALYNVKYLSINWDWYTLLAWKTGNGFPLFLNLIQLELNVGHGGWTVLRRMLQNSHNLEVLILVKNVNCRGLGLESGWKRPKNVPKCFMSSLKMVCFRGFEGLKYQQRVIKYILKNAQVLKKMDVCTDGIRFLSLDSKFEMLRKLSMFPRGSKTCQLLFN